MSIQQVFDFHLHIETAVLSNIVASNLISSVGRNLEYNNMYICMINKPFLNTIKTVII